MITLVILSIVLVVLYVGITIYFTKSIPNSVSAMVYALPAAGKYLWTVWIWAVAMLLVPALMEKLGSYWQFLGFLFAACILFCGAIPLVKHEKNTAHNITGTASGVFSQACVLLLCPWWFAAWLILLFFVLTGKTKDIHSIWYDKTITIAEAVCYICLVGSLLCK